MLSESCPYCGHSSDTFKSTNVLFKRQEDDGDSGSERSWWCFGSKKNDVPRECATDCVVVGKYEKRQSTVAYTHRLSNFTGVKKKVQDAKLGLLAPNAKRILKALLVFNSADLTYDAFARAAEKTGFDVTHCNSTDAAFDEFQSKHHDFVAIDTRSIRSLDYEMLCRGIRASKGSQHVVIIAIVKKSIFERNNGEILSLLEFGFNRCIVENPNVINYINEIVQLKMSDMKMTAQRSTTQTLYTALDKCNNLVFITDDSYRCQYVNVEIERMLNIRQVDILGKNLGETIVADQTQLSTIAATLLRGKEWIGPLTMVHKNRDKYTLHCNAVPISCYGRTPTHFVLVTEVPHGQKILQASKMSLSDRRKSTEFRKPSLNKLRSISVESPVARVFVLLEQAKNKAGEHSELLPVLDEVEDLLRKSEIFNSHELRRTKPEEPVVSDLISALLSEQTVAAQAVSSTRRSSTDSVNHKISKVKHMTTDLLDDILEYALCWNFEIFQLESVTKNRPLQNLGMHLCQHFDIGGSLNCDEKTIQNWFIIIESHYHVSNCYHNSTHAADVMQATAGFLERDRIKMIMEPLDEAMCLLAAAAHDVDHPGKSSAFLANSDNKLALLYNDITILENHHAACMFKLTLGDERVNVFKNLDRETYKVVRHCMVDMILATEMTKHFEHLTKFVNVFCVTGDEDDDNNNSSDYITLSLPENITLIKRMLIKCADVSNPTRPFRLYVEWTRRIAEEYFQQTDEEKVKGLPVVMPMFDRNTCSIPKSQIGFVDFIVNDMFEAWHAFIDMPEIITYLRQNYIRWKEFDEQGHKTLADINNLQSNMLLSPKTEKTGQ